MSKKTTNLETFVLAHIYKPYWTMLSKEPLIERLRGEYSLDFASAHLESNPEWAYLVIRRIKNIGIWFPEYVVHPLVDFIFEYEPAQVKGENDDQ